MKKSTRIVRDIFFSLSTCLVWALRVQTLSQTDIDFCFLLWFRLVFFAFVWRNHCLDRRWKSIIFPVLICGKNWRSGFKELLLQQFSHRSSRKRSFWFTDPPAKPLKMWEERDLFHESCFAFIRLFQKLFLVLLSWSFTIQGGLTAWRIQPVKEPCAALPELGTMFLLSRKAQHNDGQIAQDKSSRTICCDSSQ